MRYRWQVTGLVLVALLCGCNWRRGEGVVHTGSANPLVRNGIAFDRGVLSLGGHDTVVIPANAEVERTSTPGQPGQIVVLMEKRMGFMGHPTKRMSIHEAREEMGCAYKSEDGKVWIAAYGEFRCLEGGRHINLTFLVPPDVAIERDSRLAVDGERPGDMKPSYLVADRSSDAPSYHPRGSLEQWEPIVTSPDLDAVARYKQGERVAQRDRAAGADR